MSMKVTLPSGTIIEVPGDNSVEQVRQIVTSLGIENLANAPATETADGVVFSAPRGGSKGGL
jgi:hypothetical protein